MATAAEIQANIDKLTNNMGRFDRITNGGDTETVVTDNEVVPSVANLYRQIRGGFLQAPVDFTTGLTPGDGSFTVSYLGAIYSALPSALPFTTTGTFNPAQWAMVFRPQSGVWYVDPAGDDANPGNSPASPVLTLTRAAVLAGAGDMVLLKRGGLWRETAAFVAGVTLEPYGRGMRPVISAQDLVTSFTLNDGGPAYTFTITLPAGAEDRAYPGVWEDNRRLTEVKVGDAGIGNDAAAIAAVKATPGTFFFLGPGSYTAGWSAGSKTYHIHASDGGNPNSNGKVYEAYKREFVISSSALYRDIRIQNGFHHDGFSGAMEGGSLERLARHGGLPSTPQYTDVLSIGDNPAYIGGAFFHSNPTSLQPDAIYTRCTAVGESLNGTAFYQHGQTVGVHRRLNTFLRDCAAYNVNTCINFDEVESVHVDGFKARNFNSLVSVSNNGAALLRNIDAKGGSGGTGDGGRILTSSSSGSLEIRDSEIEFRSIGMFFTSASFGPMEIYDTKLVHVTEPVAGSTNLIAWANNATLNRFWLERCTLINPTEAPSKLVRGNTISDLRVRDCLLVGVSPTCVLGTTDTPLGTFDADARAICISREKAIASYDENGVTLKYGVYKPGDDIFSGVFHAGSARQPRRYIAVGDKIVGTTSGTATMRDWSVLGTPTSHLNAVTAFTNSAGSATHFIAVGNDGLIMRSDTSGANWVVVGAALTSEHLRAVWANDAGTVLVAVGDSGTVVLSDDYGLTWSEATTPDTTRDLYGVACDRPGTSWVACGAEGRVITSSDGDVWSESTVDTSTWRTAYFVGSTFLIGGDIGKLRTSTDNGSTWTTRTTGTMNSLRGFAWSGGGNLTAVARQTYMNPNGFVFQLDFTDTFLRTTDTGATWTIDKQTVSMELNAIVGGLNPMDSYGGGNDFIFSNNHFIAVGESQAVVMSQNSNWTLRRFLSGDTVDRSETFEKWLERTY